MRRLSCSCASQILTGLAGLALKRSRCHNRVEMAEPDVAALPRQGFGSEEASELLIPCRLTIAGSLIGGIKETQEMLDFCGKKVLPLCSLAVTCSHRSLRPTRAEFRGHCTALHCVRALWLCFPRCGS